MPKVRCRKEAGCVDWDYVTRNQYGFSYNYYGKLMFGKYLRYCELVERYFPYQSNFMRWVREHAVYIWLRNEGMGL